MNKQKGRVYLCLMVPPSFLSSVICENTAYLWFVETLASLILSHDQIFLQAVHIIELSHHLPLISEPSLCSIKYGYPSSRHIRKTIDSESAVHWKWKNLLRPGFGLNRKLGMEKFCYHFDFERVRCDFYIFLFSKEDILIWIKFYKKAYVLLF